MSVLRMKCSVCGAEAGRWEQHWNRDTGWGICRPCVDWLTKDRSMTAEEMADLYGKEGVNYAPVLHNR